MAIDKISEKELFALLDKTTGIFIELVQSVKEEEMNTIPFEKSWTAGQVADHITKSNISIAKALQLKGTPGSREPDERVEELKEVFLNFTSKLKSPSFILPSQDVYEKEIVVIRLKKSIERIKELSRQSDLAEIITHPAFGDITKLEILHFVIYHTQRHTYQLENISATLNKIKSK